MAVIYYKDFYNEGSWAHKIYRYKKSTDTYIEVDVNGTDWDYFDDDAQVGDCLYIGSRGNRTRPFDGILFYVGTPIQAEGLKIIPEYYSKDTQSWQLLKDYRDETRQLTRQGQGLFCFDITKHPDWTGVLINGISLLYIRFRIAELTSITEGGAQSDQKLFFRADAIIIKDYTSDSPCTFDDIYNADKNSSFELLPPTIPNQGLVPVYKLRPTDRLALNLTVILSSDTDATAGDTVVLHGKDIDGNILTETIGVSGAGNYTTQNKFSELDSIDCNGFSQGTITVSQPQWGVVWKNDTYYRLDKQIQFFNTYFSDNNKQVEINAVNFMRSDGIKCLYSYDSYLTFGSLVNEATKATSKGIQFFVNCSLGYWYGLLFFLGTGDINLYSCYFSASHPVDGLLYISGHDKGNRIWNCTFCEHISVSRIDYTDIFNLSVLHNASVVRRPNETTQVNKIMGNNVSYGIWFQGACVGVARDVYVRDCFNIVFMQDTKGKYCSVIDVDTDCWQIRWAGDNNGSRIYRKNTLNVRIIDGDGNPVKNARVILKDIDGNEVFSVLTDDNGEIPEQIIIRGYIEYSGVEYQDLDIDFTKDYSPHTLTIKHYLYTTYEVSFTIKEPVKQTIILTPDPFIYYSESDASNIGITCEG